MGIVWAGLNVTMDDFADGASDFGGFDTVGVGDVDVASNTGVAVLDGLKGVT